MWWKEYADYRYDEPMKKQRVEPGKGIAGCEMRDLHGYGVTKHRSQYRKKRGVLTSLFAWLFGIEEKADG